ncbi:hypothetical protein Tco_1369752 [Tanacetum coccineum]
MPPHLEYAFLEGDDKLPVIIAKDLKDEEKAALLKVLKSHKRAIAWKLSDIKGVSPEFCTHKILMEEDYEPFCANPWVSTVLRRCVSGQEALDISQACHSGPTGDTMVLLVAVDYLSNGLKLRRLPPMMPDLSDFPDCEDSRAYSIHMSFTSSASFWESSIQI